LRPRTYSTQGLVIRQYPLGEADRILTLLTRDMGKIRVVAKGLRRPKSKLSGQMELLSHVSLTASVGRDLDVVTEAQTVNSHPNLTEHLDKLSHGIYLCELLDRFTVEHEPNYEAYKLAIDTLSCLESATDSWLVIRHFEMRLLDESGFLPELTQCVECGSKLEPQDHRFDVSAGGIACPDCGVGDSTAVVPVQLNAMKVLRLLQRERLFDRLEGLRISKAARYDVERLLTTHIRYILERELRSADFVRKVSQLAPAPSGNHGSGDARISDVGHE
jgi:DNA repair protein RecO (recombination protein O)